MKKIITTDEKAQPKGWRTLKLAWSHWTQHDGDQRAAALSGVMATLLWMNLSSCVVVFGICFCAARAEVRDESPKRGENHG